VPVDEGHDLSWHAEEPGIEGTGEEVGIEGTGDEVEGTGDEVEVERHLRGPAGRPRSTHPWRPGGAHGSGRGGLDRPLEVIDEVLEVTDQALPGRLASTDRVDDVLGLGGP
jgi:hypothetical protein